MANIVPYNEMKDMALSVTKSGMFGLKNENQALTLMLIAQAENIAPIQAIQMYSIIQGLPALKSTEIQARFQRAGGKIKWLETSDQKAICELSIDGQSYKSEFGVKEAKQMELMSKDNYKKMPKQMFMARAVSSGVRAIFPQCLNNMYAIEELSDISTKVEVEEAEIIAPQLSLKVEKTKLKNKMEELNFSIKEIREFADYFGITEDAEAIHELIMDDVAFTKNVNEFELILKGNEDDSK